MHRYLAWIPRYERQLSALGMIGGFVTDNFMFRRVDLPNTQILFLVYLAVAALTILVLHGINSHSTRAPEEKPLDSISAMYAALRACWVPPPKDEAFHGMEYTIRFAFKRDGEIIASPRVTYASHGAPANVRDVYRDAVNAALARCAPLHFSEGMGGAVAGRPIAIRFVDDRTADKSVE